jgi:diaminohydroxyphosphoribosylaminopyrimidine deaminase/5-amino-6-(5-phosphoribosylamino)uracil reductase
MLQKPGVDTLVVPEQDGRVDVCTVLRLLGEQGVTSVLAECGGTLAASLVAAGAVDKILGFVAPKIVGGATAPTPVEGEGLPRMDCAIELREATWTVLGRDVLLTATLASARPVRRRKRCLPASWRRSASFASCGRKASR